MRLRPNAAAAVKAAKSLTQTLEAIGAV